MDCTTTETGRQRGLSHRRIAGLIITLGLAAASIPLRSQTDGNGPQRRVTAEPELGFYGGYQRTMHDADFTGLPGIACCSPGFTGGTGPGFALGGLMNLPLTDRLALRIRAGWSTLRGALTVTEYIGNAVENDAVVEATVEHRIEPSFGMIVFEPSILWYPFGFPLALSVGAEDGYIITKRYEQRETLLTPRSATFADGRTVRNESSGEIPDVTENWVAAVAGISFDIRLGRSVIFSPEASFRFNVTNAIADTSWYVHSLRLGASLRFGHAPLVDPSPIPTTEPATMLAATVTATGVDDQGVESPAAQLRVEEFLATELHPILTYIFFEQKEDVIPARYAALDREETPAFTIDALHSQDAIGVYHQVLNIIGQRMRRHPEATLRLVGCNSDDETERGDPGLSRRRAEAVREYLTDVWEIDDQRITTEARSLPEKPSNVADPDGVAENRRVEIYATDPAILAPIETHDTTRSANPPIVRFRPRAVAVAGMERWRLAVAQQGTIVREFEGEGAAPDVIDWNLGEEIASTAIAAGALDYRFEITDNDGRWFATPVASIRAEELTLRRKRIERIDDKEINRYSLILFDFGKSDIGEANRRIIDLVRNRIAPNAETTVTGYTDRMGDAALNQRLSQDRANAAATTLGAPTVNVIGLGESAPQHDNDLPEGRFYSRIVNITVETPIAQ